MSRRNPYDRVISLLAWTVIALLIWETGVALYSENLYFRWFVMDCVRAGKEIAARLY